MSESLPGARSTRIPQRNPESERICYSCGHDKLAMFYEQVGVPVDSCRLLGRRDEAKIAPLGDLRLGVCLKCGFISNNAFDPAVSDESAAYEETQGFSPFFQGYLKRLAHTLIHKYDLRNKDLFEIGCGQGDFLELMCRIGQNRGIGLDPSLKENKIKCRGNKCIRYIKDHFSESYSNVIGDFVICRHTLEHIQPVREFLCLIRNALGNRSEVILFFEVPNMKRILDDGAFWDIYFEHCSYFTCGSLARLLRDVGFEVLDVSPDFSNQYILIDCRAGKENVGLPVVLEDKPEDVVQAIHGFKKIFEDKKTNWKKTLDQIFSRGHRAVLWGSASKAAAFSKAIGIEGVVKYIININPHHHGKYAAGTGQKIVPPEFLKRDKPDIVINMNPVYHEEISQMIDNMSISVELLSV